MNRIREFVVSLFARADRPVAPASERPEPEAVSAPGGSALASGPPEVSALGRGKGYTLEGGIKWHRI
jgi:hypothetical protein